MKEYKIRAAHKFKENPESFTHGRQFAYSMGCRCDACRAFSASRVSGKHRYKDFDKASKVKRPDFCELCQRSSKNLVIDHDHKTGEFRGFICHTCNSGLGKLGDNLEGLKSAINYLETAPNRRELYF